jgi:hypothetical protein
VVVILWKLDLQLSVQLVPSTTKVVSSNPVHGEVYSIQHYLIKFVSDLRQVGGFLRVLLFIIDRFRIVLKYLHENVMSALRKIFKSNDKRPFYVLYL